MNNQQTGDVNWDEIEQLLAQDCEIRSRYINAYGQTCAIGYLAKAAGVPDEVLKTAGKKGIGSYTLPVVTIREAIQARFGLDALAMAEIQHANDSDPYDPSASHYSYRRMRNTKKVKQLRRERVLETVRNLKEQANAGR